MLYCLSISDVQHAGAFMAVSSGRESEKAGKIMPSRHIKFGGNMASYWRHSIVVLAAAAALSSVAGCEGCTPVDNPKPDPKPDEGCADYCDLVMAACTGDNQLYADEATCLSTCEGFPTTGAKDDASGDTLQCRTFHAGAAADDATHCAHASAQGGNVCGSNCDVYCRLMGDSCSGFEDTATCLSTCASYPADGAIDAPDGNTVQCRTYHAGAAAADATHCEHAGITGGGVCGADACEAYCDQVMVHCGGAQALYPDRAACMTTCANIPADGAWDATDGNSVQCRAYHGAGAAAADPAAHCAHASVNGGGACGTYCDSYCDQVMANCTDGNALYADRAACSTACGQLRVGSDYAVSGDSVQCRTMHASYPSATDPAGHCGHAATVSAGDVCADPVAPPTTINISGAIHEMGNHLANTHIGVVGASILAFGVDGNISTTTAAEGAYTLTNVPANGQAVLFASKAGYQPTYTTVVLGSTNVTASLLLGEAAWVESLNTTYGVSPTTPFDCQFNAALDCVYALVIGQILDDGSNDAEGDRLPVAGVSAVDITVTGGPDNVPWRHQGPYFLNANGTAGNNSTSQAAGLYAVYVEIPQIEAGYNALHIELAIQYGVGGAARYFGPLHTSAYRGPSTAVTWANIEETGVPPGGGGGTIAFDSQIYPLFLPTAQGGYGCQGCHTNQNGANAAGGLNLYGGADVAYASLNPDNYPARVNVDDPAASLLLTKPLYQGGGAQNHPIFAWVSPQDPAYQLIDQWIDEGAQRVAAGQRVSFIAQIKPMLGNATGAGGIGCVGCHTGGNPANLQLEGTASEVYDEVTAEAAVDDSNTGEAYRINKAGYPERSLLLTNPLSGNSESHPQKPFASAADPRYQLLYRWVSEGYTNDGYCEDYCTGIQATCNGGNQQYADQQSCLSACGAMPRGSDTDTDVDTLGCRNYHLGAAGADPATHCPHAGPGGGGVCGTWTQTVCRQLTQSCTGDEQQFTNAGECEGLLSDVPATGAAGDLSGDTIQCRSAHMQVATGDATHCDHAGFSGGDVCGGWCEVYCRDIQAYCTDGNAEYADNTECQTACSTFATTGSVGDLTGNTVQCRLEHLKYAEADAAVHCPHAGEASAAGVCQ
jgi:hypothetical protein